MPTIAIIGGGFAGVQAAEKLLKQNAVRKQNGLEPFKVYLYEQDNQLYGPSGSSASQVFRVQLSGLHYVPDNASAGVAPKTSLDCFEAALKLAEEHSDCFVGGSNPDNWEPGYYYVLEDESGSQTVLDDFRETAKQITQAYRKSESTVAGKPEDLIVEMPVDDSTPEYIEQDKDGEKVKQKVIGIFKVKEPTVNIDALRKKVSRNLRSYPANEFSLNLGVKVDSITVDPTDFGYELHVKGVTHSLKVDAVINATWSKMHELKAGLKPQLEVLPKVNSNREKEDVVVVRTKLSLRVFIDPENKALLRTVIFCKGAHNSRSVLDYKTGETVITHELVTNVGVGYIAGEQEPCNEIKTLRQAQATGKLSPADGLGKGYADNIMELAKLYVPEHLRESFMRSRIGQLKLGDVCQLVTREQALQMTQDRKYLQSTISPHQSRDRHGAVADLLLFFDFFCYKMTYAVQDADALLIQIEKHLKMRDGAKARLSQMSLGSADANLAELEKMRNVVNSRVKLEQYYPSSIPEQVLSIENKVRKSSDPDSLNSNAVSSRTSSPTDSRGSSQESIEGSPTLLQYRQSQSIASSITVAPSSSSSLAAWFKSNLKLPNIALFNRALPARPGQITLN